MSGPAESDGGNGAISHLTAGLAGASLGAVGPEEQPMDHWLDDLARGSANGLSRRAVLRRLGAGLATAVLASLGFGTEARADFQDFQPNKPCLPPNVPCKSTSSGGIGVVGCCPPDHACTDTGCCPKTSSWKVCSRGTASSCCPSTGTCCNAACCPSYTTCLDGKCVCSPRDGGGVFCSGTCCEQGKTCCDNTCINPKTDPNNCGQCGNYCTIPKGRCCDGVCVDWNTDPNNCGGCGKTCRSGETCAKGACVPTGTCPSGYFFCNVNPLYASKCCGVGDSCCAAVSGTGENVCCKTGCCATLGGCCPP